MRQAPRRIVSWERIGFAGLILAVLLLAIILGLASALLDTPLFVGLLLFFGYVLITLSNAVLGFGIVMLGLPLSQSWSAFGLPREILIGIFAPVILGSAFAGWQHRMRKSILPLAVVLRANKIVVAYVLVILLSNTWNAVRFDRLSDLDFVLRWTLFALLGPAFYLAFYRVASTKILAFSKLVTISAIVYALDGIWQFVTQSGTTQFLPGTNVVRGVSVIGYATIFGWYLALYVPIVFQTTLAGRGIDRVVALFAGVVLVIGIVVSAARAALFAIIVTGVLLVAVKGVRDLTTKTPRARRVPPIALLVIVAACIVALLFLSPLGLILFHGLADRLTRLVPAFAVVLERLGSLLSFTSLLADRSALSRLVIWELSIGLIRRFPLFGLGSGYTNQYLTGTVLSQHNNFMFVANEIGLPGAMLFVLLMAVALWRAWRIVLSIEPADPRWIYGGGTLGALLVFALGGVTESLNYHIATYYTFWFFLVCVAVLERSILSSSSADRSDCTQ